MPRAIRARFSSAPVSRSDTGGRHPDLSGGACPAARAAAAVQDPAQRSRTPAGASSVTSRRLPRVRVIGMADLGRLLITLGGVLLILGVLLSLGGRIPWLGRLPGDIVIERENFRFYFPLATSIILSIVLSLLAMLFRR
jgi:hypothetical protein